MTVHINDILAEYHKLQDTTYIRDIEQNGITNYDYNLRKEIPANNLSYSKNHALILAIIMLKKDSITYSISKTFIKYAINENLLKSSPSWIHISYVPDYLNYSIINGITKNVTKKSLNMFTKKIVDKLFKVNGIAKRSVTRKSSKSIVFKSLNNFTLATFKHAFKLQTLHLTELKRVINDIGAYNYNANFSLEWSNAVFKALKPSTSGYRYIYNNTKDKKAEIFKNIIVVGEKSFTTPVENYYRDHETDKYTITTATDISDFSSTILMKAAIEAPIDSPIYNHIITGLNGTKSELQRYIVKLIAIQEDIII